MNTINDKSFIHEIKSKYYIFEYIGNSVDKLIQVYYKVCKISLFQEGCV